MNGSDAFVILANHQEKDRRELHRCLQLVECNHPCTPLVLFYEDAMVPHLEGIVAQHNWITPVRIEFKLPPHITEAVAQQSTWRLGYRHMCQFFANDWFYHPALTPYRYLCRLDSDSELLSSCGSLFQSMRNARGSYGYIGTDYDQPSVSAGLWKTARRFISEAGIETLLKKQIDAIPEAKYYQTNFELCDKEWFTQSRYRDYANYITQDGGIYRTRWGDHIIRYLGVQMFMDQSEIWHMPVCYQHQFFRSC